MIVLHCNDSVCLVPCSTVGFCQPLVKGDCKGPDMNSLGIKNSDLPTAPVETRGAKGDSDSSAVLSIFSKLEYESPAASIDCKTGSSCGLTTKRAFFTGITVCAPGTGIMVITFSARTAGATLFTC